MHATTSSKHHLPIGSSKVHEQTGGCNYNPSKPQPLCPPTLPVVHGRIDLPLLGPLEAVCPKDHIVHDEVKPKEEVQKHWRAAPRHITQEPCPGLFKAVIGEPSLKTNTEQHLYKHDWVGKQWGSNLIELLPEQYTIKTCHFDFESLLHESGYGWINGCQSNWMISCSSYVFLIFQHTIHRIAPHCMTLLCMA